MRTSHLEDGPDLPDVGPAGGVRRTGLARVVDLGSFRRQLVLSTGALSTLVAVAMVLTVQFLLVGSADESVRHLLRDRADAVTTAVSSATSGRDLRVPDAVVDPGTTVYSQDGRLVAGYVSPHQSDDFADLSRVGRERTRKVGDDFVLLARPFTTRSGARGVVVLSERLAPFQEDERDALVVSIFAGVVLVVVATGLAGWASRRALAPVAQMARTAEAWSEHELGRRFDLGPPVNEIRALGQTLDGLLDKVQRAIITEQRLTSELAHELRSPLAAVQGTAELVGMRDDLDPQLREDIDDIQASCRRMAATVTSLLELARAQSSARSDADCSLTEVVAAVVASVGHGDRVAQDVPDRLRAAVPPELAVRALAPVVDNAVRFAEHVSVTATVVGQQVRVTVSDDGPGVAAEAAEQIFRAGQTDGGGSGLGLALARRIARSVGGDVVLSQRDGAGATFVVTLPARSSD